MLLTPNLDKQEEATELAELYSGTIYVCVGVHPHNIKRTNDKLYQQQLDNLRSLVRQNPLRMIINAKQFILSLSLEFNMCSQSLEAVAVALFSGLDLTREIGIHFPQEKMLIAQLGVAVQVGISSLLHPFAQHLIFQFSVATEFFPF